jgi:Mn-dependent DtxR family transcriptional regulator
MSTPTIETYLRLADSKSLEVLFWLLHNRDSENVITATLDQVATECSVTKVTVNRMFQKLYKEGFLSKIRNGQYKLHKV